MNRVTTIHRFDQIESLLTEASDRRALFSDPDFSALVTARLEELLDGPRKILSFDVFDTLFLRDNSSEYERFHAIGAAIAEIASERTGRKLTAEDGFVARHFGTKATYRAGPAVRGYREGSLTELHKVASCLLTGSPDLAEAFVEAELAHEMKTLTLNPLLAGIARRHKAAGGRVLLLSDMYMHAEQIGRLGEGLGWTAEDCDLILSSADEKLSKASGTIFPLAEERLDASADAFVHVGDSHTGDMMQPLRAGWSALHLPVSAAEIHERRASHRSVMEKVRGGTGFVLDIAMPV